jgi:hypothetical protein
MFPAASRPDPLRRWLFAATTALLAGCGGSPSVASPPPDEVTVVTTFDGGTPDASTMREAAPGDAPIAAPVAQGSPLCNASRSTGCCYPDDPGTATAQACAQAACQMPIDAGATEAAALFGVNLGCHVASGAMALPAATGSSTGGATLASSANTTATVCLSGGIGLDGFHCDGPSDCAPSLECVGQGICRHYCCAGNASCDDSHFCDIQPSVVAAGASVPVCVPIVPIEHCVLLASGWCAPGETCAVVRENGATSCVAIGNAGPGQSCETEHCGAGLVCLGTMGERTCNVLCHTATAAECSANQKCKGGYPLFPDPDVGICQ